RRRRHLDVPLWPLRRLRAAASAVAITLAPAVLSQLAAAAFLLVCPPAACRDRSALPLLAGKVCQSPGGELDLPGGGRLPQFPLRLRRERSAGRIRAAAVRLATLRRFGRHLPRGESLLQAGHRIGAVLALHGR